MLDRFYGFELRALHWTNEILTLLLSSALLKNAVCVTQANGDTIAGVAWIKVAMMPVDTNKPELIYFQRMYIAPEHRCVRAANQLINAFHHHLIRSNQRSPRVRYLLAENANPKLKTPVGRRLFIRRGFKFMGFNSYGNEIWKLALPPTTGPSCFPVFRWIDDAHRTSI